MDINDHFYNKDRDDIYHPFSDYNENKYLPEESLTKQLVLIRLIWDDILCLSETYKEQKDIHKGKAILKYIMMDMCSLYDKFQEFKELVIQDKSIRCEQQKEILEKFDLFLPKLKDFSKGTYIIPAGKYRNVRNKLSAHRDRNIPLSKVKSMWDNLHYEDIENISEKIKQFYSYLRDLGICQWARFNKNSTVEIINEASFIEVKKGRTELIKDNKISMSNEKESFKEIMRCYWEKEEEVREYRKQFFTITWDGKIIREAKKYLGSEEIKTLQKMEYELEELHKEYIEALNKTFDW